MLNAGIVEVYQDSSNLQTCTRYTTCSDVLSGERLGFFDGSWLSRHSSDHNRALCWGSTCRGALQLDKNSARVQVTCHHTNAFVLFSAPTSASRGPSCLGRRDRRRPRRGAQRQNIEEYITGSHHASSTSSKACRRSGGRKHWEDQCDNYRTV